jgi:hypothetical protein
MKTSKKSIMSNALYQLHLGQRLFAFEQNI